MLLSSGYFGGQEASDERVRLSCFFVFGREVEKSKNKISSSPSSSSSSSSSSSDACIVSLSLSTRKQKAPLTLSRAREPRETKSALFSVVSNFFVADELVRVPRRAAPAAVGVEVDEEHAGVF